MLWGTAMRAILKGGACVVGAMIVGLAILHLYPQSTHASVNIEDRRAFWNGRFGDRTKGSEVTGGEVHGWVHPHSLVPLEVDPYPPSYDGRPPPRRWFDSKNGLR